MEQTIEFLSTMPFWYWWIFAIAFLLLEFLTGTTYLLWPAAAAILVGILALAPLHGNWQLQILSFAILTALLTLWAAPRVKPWIHKAREDHPLLNERGARKIGRKVSAETDFHNGVGRIRLDDTLWLAETEDGQDYPVKTQMEIIDIKGSKIIVKVSDNKMASDG